MQEKRIQIIHALRGFACLLVIIDHMFFSTPYFNIGACGVGIFFLISGFVIPISARATTSSEYLIRRIFRIYPIAIVTTLAIYLISTYCFNVWISLVAQFNLEITTFSMITAMFHIWDIVNADPIRPIFWTLVIEEKFYLLFFIIKRFSPDVQLNRVLMVFYPLLFTFLCVSYVTENTYAASVILRNCTFISFMLLGTLLYFSYTGEIKIRTHNILSACLLLSSLVCLLLSPYGKCFDMTSGYYIVERFSLYSKWAAVVAYMTAYVAFRIVLYYRTHPILDGWSRNKYICLLANISYPLYVIHQNVNTNFPSLVKFRPINSLMPFAIAVAISYLLHISIELPSIKLGRRVASILKRRRLSFKPATQ
jgi:peptidoglycan/LPS O-acetylase OafA/YrhL